MLFAAGPARLSDEQITITEHVPSFGAPPVPVVWPDRGDPGRGADVYLLNHAPAAMARPASGERWWGLATHRR